MCFSLPVLHTDFLLILRPPPPELLRDQSHLSATDRLALILRLRDPSFLAEHLASHLRDFTQCEQLILVLQKVLYGNLARQAQAAVGDDAAAANGGANLPACARGLRYCTSTGVGVQMRQNYPSQIIGLHHNHKKRQFGT